MKRVFIIVLMTLLGIATSLLAQVGGISSETYKGLYQVGGILYYNPSTEEGTPGQMTATTHYQPGAEDPFSVPEGSLDPSGFSDPSVFVDPIGGGDPFGDPFGVMDPSMMGGGEEGGDPFLDPLGGNDTPKVDGTAARARLRQPSPSR